MVVEVRTTLEADRLQAVPPFCESATVPVNPLTADTWIVENPGELTFTSSPVGLAVMVKSWTLIEKVAVWTTPLALAVIVTV